MLPEPLVLDPLKFNPEWAESDTFIIHNDIKVVPEHPCRLTFDASYPYVSRFPDGNAVDVGARYGEYTRYLISHFDHVYCFEPRDNVANKFARNVDVSKVSFYPTAIGDQSGTVDMYGGAIGKDGPKEHKHRTRPVHTLDQFDLPDVRYIKIDVEGYELKVLKGAVNTIQKYRPLIVIEQNGQDERFGHSESGEASQFLINLDYEIVDQQKFDLIMIPKEKRGD